MEIFAKHYAELGRVRKEVKAFSPKISRKREREEFSEFFRDYI